MPVSAEFAAFVVEQMAPLGRIESKRMFGGYGIFRGGLMFALMLNDELYFKVDQHSVERFTARGLDAFRYQSRGRTMALGYHKAPPEVFDEADVMREWGEDAFACALRKQQGARVRRKPGKRTPESSMP